jgi:CheY-like chemotaxis protein
MTLPACERTVLVVEDDQEVRDAIAEVLEDCEYKALPASNGAEALERLRTAEPRPCVILLDVMMPTMDGWAFRAVQRRDPAMKDIPVVLLSAHTDVKSAAAQMQVAGFLPKPVAIDKLLATVERFCIADRGATGNAASGTGASG